MSRKLLTVILLLALTMSMFSGCGNKGDEVKKQTKDSVTMAINADISTLDPHDHTVLLSRVVMQNMYEPLLQYYQGEFTPVLCESYKVSDDGLKYTFALKKNVKFHNGEVMKASDVVFSMNRAKSMAPMAAYTACISKAEALDDNTVVITVTKPYVPFLLSVGATIYIVSEKAAKELGDNLKNKPVGTGPYKFVKWDAGQQVVIERFDGWHGGTAPIKTATFKVIGDPSSAVVALETVEIDLTYTMPTIAAKNIEKNPKLTLQKVPTLGSGFMLFNLDKAPMNDINFRTAVCYAVDKQKLIDIGLEGAGIISDGIWTKDTVGYSDKIKGYEYNLDKAKEYLKKSPYDGKELVFKAGNDTYKKLAALIQEDLRKVGINIKIEQEEANAWIQDMLKGNYELTLIVMTKAADADLWSNVLHSKDIDKVLNFARLRNKEVDDAFDKGSSIMDPKKRVENYERVSKVLKEEAIITPLYFKVATPAYSKDLEVKRCYPDGYAYIQDMRWK